MAAQTVRDVSSIQRTVISNQCEGVSRSELKLESRWMVIFCLLFQAEIVAAGLILNDQLASVNWGNFQHNQTKQNMTKMYLNHLLILTKQDQCHSPGCFPCQWNTQVTKYGCFLCCSNKLGSTFRGFRNVEQDWKIFLKWSNFILTEPTHGTS